MVSMYRSRVLSASSSVDRLPVADDRKEMKLDRIECCAIKVLTLTFCFVLSVDVFRGSQNTGTLLYYFDVCRGWKPGL